MASRKARTAIVAAAKGYSLTDLSRGLPVPEPVEGQLELELPEPHPSQESRDDVDA